MFNSFFLIKFFYCPCTPAHFNVFICPLIFNSFCHFLSVMFSLAVWCVVGCHRWFVLNYVINVGLSGSSQPKLERFHHSLQGYPQAGCARGRIGRWEEREKSEESAGWLGTWNNIYKDKENKRVNGNCCQIRHCNQSA